MDIGDRRKFGFGERISRCPEVKRKQKEDPEIKGPSFSLLLDFAIGRSRHVASWGLQNIN